MNGYTYAPPEPEPEGIGELIASFASHPNGWHWVGALYGMIDGRGPYLLTYCPHRHRSMRQATECAERELQRATRTTDA